MRSLLLSAALVLVAPTAAHAGWIFNGSVGYGYQLDPNTETEGVNFMIHPGYTFLGDMLRAELGFVTNRSSLDDDTDFQVRPMLVLDPPVFPLYGRAILAVTNLKDDAVIAYGGAVGTSFSIVGLGAFAEIGALPRSVSGTQIWVAEARAGAYFSF